MARRSRRKSGDTEWVGLTGTISKPADVGVTQVLGTVTAPRETYTAPGQPLPAGTLLRTMGRISVTNTKDQALDGTSFFAHGMAALHTDEAVLDSTGALNTEPLLISDEDNLGFEGLFWLGSCILWQALNGGGTDAVAAHRGCTIDVDSKAKRILSFNDQILMDVAEVVQQLPLDFAYDLRLLIKHA